MYYLDEETMDQIKAFIDFAIKHHPDQESRLGAKMLKADLEKLIEYKND